MEISRLYVGRTNYEGQPFRKLRAVVNSDSTIKHVNVLTEDVDEEIAEIKAIGKEAYIKKLTLVETQFGTVLRKSNYEVEEEF